MFRLHRHKSGKSGERTDFKFSDLQAIQVPKGWDKLFVSIISVETGKTIVKSSKALVRNGNCQWTETLSESIWVSQDETSKEFDESLYKLVVAMGSARSGILGEATVNLTGYMSSRASVPVSLPLKKCNHGTTLQVKIQCLTPRTTTRDEQWKDTNPQVEDLVADYDELDTRSVGSSSSNHLGSSLHPGETGSRNTSFSASGSRHSSDSAEGLIGRENFSPRSISNEDAYNHVRRQVSTGSQNGGVHAAYPGDDPSRSNPSSFNSRVANSGSQIQNQMKEPSQSPAHVIATSSLKNTSSSKDLLEAAEDTIEELRAVAGMWERNARKLMLDLEISRKEFSEQSKKQATLDMELSAAYTERDNMKKETEQLKVLLEEALVKQTAAEDSKFQANAMTHIQKELEDELKFQQESNANLDLQLKKTQESNIQLVSVLQELEETIEKQKLELDNLSGKQFEAEDNRDLELQLQQLQKSQKKLQANVTFLEKKVEDRNREIEIERSLKTQSLLDIEAEWRYKLSAKEEEITKLEAKLFESHSAQRSDETGSTIGADPTVREVEALKEKIQELERDCNELTDENLELLFNLKESKKDLLSSELKSEVCELKSKIYQLEEELKKKETINEEVASSHLQVQLIDLENRRTAMELQLQSFKDKASNLDAELHKSQVQVEENEMKITSLQNQLESYHRKETDGEDQFTLASTRSENSGSDIATEGSDIYSEVFKQLRLTLARARKLWYNIFPHVNIGCEYDFDNLENLNITDSFSQKEQAEAILNNLLGLDKLVEARFIECEDAFQELKRSKMELETKVTDLNKELDADKTRIGKLESTLLLKEEEAEVQKRCQRELEVQVSALQKEKSQLEENMELVIREGSITSKCLDDLRNELMMLGTSMDSHVSANKILERKSSDLESNKYELEIHLSELEEENVRLSERISGMEARLRYLTDERESNRLELENSESLAMNLQDDIRRLGIEMETQKSDLKQKLQDMQNRWTEAQEECKYLQRANPELQSTAESLIEECSSLQKSNGDLRKQKQELHEHCTQLEAELRESRKCLSDCSKRVEVLEAKLSSMEKDFALKEELLTSQLDELLDENKEHKEKVILGESLLNQLYLDKAVEVENLQREVALLMDQISATHDERERIASDAVLEVSNLRADKAKLETILQELHTKVKFSENELYTLQTESGEKVKRLMCELAVSKQNQELRMTDHGKLLTLFEDVKSSEEKFKNTVNGLELKLSASEYEKQQLVEEIACLKVQLKKITHIQDEVLALKSSLNETKFQKEKLEASLQLVSRDCKELKAERTSFTERISSLQKVVSELEDCRRTKVALEEKLLRLEGDLRAREALCAQDAELKNELSRIKRGNSQFQQKIQQLEEEKDEFLRRAQALEEELKMKNEKDLKISEGHKHHFHNGSSQGTGVEPASKIQLPENELADASEANNMYKVQLERLLPEGQNNHVEASKKLTAEDGVPRKVRYERNSSSLEAELKDIHERYFHMSLRYAEVEAQREELVMKLKAVKSGKRWFS